MATAMTNTGAATLIGDQVTLLVGDAGPRAALTVLFLVAAAITQFIANRSRL